MGTTGWWLSEADRVKISTACQRLGREGDERMLRDEVN